MNNPGLIKNLVAGTAITKHRIVKFGDKDHEVLQAAHATDSILGVCAELDATASSRVDIILSGACHIEYGEDISRGDQLTSDTTGRAVKVTPVTGETHRIIGIATESGEMGDIGSVLISQSSFSA